MDRLVSIGPFAEMTGLTVKALRLYDRLGLLRPALVDVHSGYRYYAAEQRATAARIRALRGMEMPLREIAALLKADNPAIREALLAGHRRRIEERINRYQRVRGLLTRWEDQVRKERAMTSEEKVVYCCSFCGKTNDNVRRMIAGPKQVYICNECIDLCNEIIRKEESKAG